MSTPENNFKKDNTFSVHKDWLLEDYWGKNSYGGKYIIVDDKDLQKAGIDILMRDPNHPFKNKKIDTKHDSKFTGNVMLEEFSCTITGHEADGWLTKKGPCPHKIIFCFWPECDDCKTRYNSGCRDCPRNTLKCIIYESDFQSLKNWFLKNKNNYPLFTQKTNNKSAARVTKIEDLEREDIMKKTEEICFDINDFKEKIKDISSGKIAKANNEEILKEHSKRIDTLECHVADLRFKWAWYQRKSNKAVKKDVYTADMFSQT